MRSRPESHVRECSLRVSAAGPLRKLLEGVKPYIYLIDVLQRVERHPAKRAIELTLRVGKTLFADNPPWSHVIRATLIPCSQGWHHEP